MKAVMVMFDTLSRRYLSTYGNHWVPTPNFKRLEERSIVFDDFHCGSLPCMPARRELHTGRLNFLHRSWGPLEPFDCSAMEILKNQGVYTHIVTDHSHYWEDGGATYLTRYHTWEGFRGQEGDRWMPILAKEELGIPKLLKSSKQTVSLYHNYANRQQQTREEQMSTVQTFDAGIRFLDHYHAREDWFLQIEGFDPHEPFVVPERFLKQIQDEYHGDYFDWPAYRQVSETREECAHLVKRYGALIAMCDEQLGRVLDAFDRYELWKDTMLIVATDHGFLMGEHDWWGKNVQPPYREVTHLPFYLYHPELAARRTDLLAQTIDIAPTLLEAFGCTIPKTMQGHSLLAALKSDRPIREAVLYGVFGGHVCVENRDAVYMRASVSKENGPLFEYTLMPTHMRGFFDQECLKQAELIDSFRFTEGMPVLKVPGKAVADSYAFGHLLFDLKQDEKQEHPIHDAALEQKMIALLLQGMKESEADEAQYIRLGLNKRN